MKFFFNSFCFFLILALPLAVNAQTGNEEYSVIDSLKKEDSRRRQGELKDFYDGPRETTLSVSVGYIAFLGMHASLSDGNANGISCASIWHANSDTPDLKLHFGLELMGFDGKRSYENGSCNVRSLDLLFVLGASYDFSNRFSIGAHFGLGILGASYMERKDTIHGNETTGTLSTTFSFQPYGEFLINKNFSLYGAYRFFYMAPSVFSSLTNWGEIESAGHGAEFGLRYRF